MHQNSPAHLSRKSGFTLIELSIVLVIIGLIVGGVLVGRDLIASAQIRAQIKQIDEFKTAINIFKVKYNSLPGDMPPSEATQLGFFTFIGTYAGRRWNAMGVEYGDNNGRILESESYVFWQHLSQANMIDGNYGGSVSSGKYIDSNALNQGGIRLPAFNSSTPISDYRIFAPASVINSSVGQISLQSNISNTVSLTKIYTNAQKINMLSLQHTRYSYGDKIISAVAAFQIDNKIDDGLPDTGLVREQLTGDFGFAFRMPSAANVPCTTAIAPFQYDLGETNGNGINCNALDFLF